ncbi:bacteriorhodopsin-like [Flavobacteriaceae bacterium]|nr:bacteriorhodopsin-like [Flavobacteriaceae bacterium]|tara:strand:+ start:368 stop:1096 length:729 start_codon:yes stop_codon:yes gene_type:complete
MELFLNTFYFFGDVPAGDDLVGITFWLGTMAMMAASVFFFLNLNAVDAKWRSSILVSGLITFIAAVHYMYMRDAHAAGDSTTVFRYVDWILTVPLMCVEFYLILKAAGATTKHLKVLVWASVAMLLTGYVGEAGLGHAGWWGAASGAAYFYILYLVKFGELGKLAAKAGGNVQSAHNTLVWFVFAGWAIYPVGYMIGTGEGMWYEFMTNLVSAENIDLVYNVGDSINKIGFGLVVYNLAISK